VGDEEDSVVVAVARLSEPRLHVVGAAALEVTLNQFPFTPAVCPGTETLSHPALVRHWCK